MSDTSQEERSSLFTSEETFRNDLKAIIDIAKEQNKPVYIRRHGIIVARLEPLENAESQLLYKEIQSSQLIVNLDNGWSGYLADEAEAILDYEEEDV